MQCQRGPVRYWDHLQFEVQEWDEQWDISLLVHLLDTSYYDRTLSANTLVVKTAAALEQLKCSNVKVDEVIDLMKEKT